MNALWWHFPVSGVETWLWMPPLAALVIAFLTSMVGISGAFLLVPFQLSVLGFASPAASATNLVFNLVAIPSGMYRYWREIRFRQGGHEHAFPTAAMLGFSFLVGVVGTAYGIGGGSFMVPLCLAVWRLPVHAIAGATLTATFLTSAIALAAYFWLPAPAGVAVRPDWLLGLSFGLGGLIGAYLGARLQKHVPQRVLKGFLALILAGLALRYALPG